MKKLLASLLIAGAGIGFAACGGSSNEGANRDFGAWQACQNFGADLNDYSKVAVAHHGATYAVGDGGTICRVRLTRYDDKFDYTLIDII